MEHKTMFHKIKKLKSSFRHSSSTAFPCSRFFHGTYEIEKYPCSMSSIVRHVPYSRFRDNTFFFNRSQCSLPHVPWHQISTKPDHVYSLWNMELQIRLLLIWSSMELEWKSYELNHVCIERGLNMKWAFIGISVPWNTTQYDHVVVSRSVPCGTWWW